MPFRRRRSAAALILLGLCGCASTPTGPKVGAVFPVEYRNESGDPLSAGAAPLRAKLDLGDIPGDLFGEPSGTLQTVNVDTSQGAAVDLQKLGEDLSRKAKVAVSRQ